MSAGLIESSFFPITEKIIILLRAKPGYRKMARRIAPDSSKSTPFNNERNVAENGKDLWIVSLLVPIADTDGVCASASGAISSAQWMFARSGICAHAPRLRALEMHGLRENRPDDHRPCAASPPWPQPQPLQRLYFEAHQAQPEGHLIRLPEHRRGDDRRDCSRRQDRIRPAHSSSCRPALAIPAPVLNHRAALCERQRRTEHARTPVTCEDNPGFRAQRRICAVQPIVHLRRSQARNRFPSGAVTRTGRAFPARSTRHARVRHETARAR